MDNLEFVGMESLVLRPYIEKSLVRNSRNIEESINGEEVVMGFGIRLFRSEEKAEKVDFHHRVPNFEDWKWR